MIDGSDKNKQKLSKSIPVSGKPEFYKRHLNILNALIPNKEKQLTEKEVEVLSLFMCEPVDYRFSTEARKKVMDALTLSRAGVSNYLTQLLRKGYLVSVNTRMKYAVNPAVEPVADYLQYDINLELDNS